MPGRHAFRTALLLLCIAMGLAPCSRGLTASPPNLSVRLARAAVSPGDRQTITVKTAGGMMVGVTVTFPNGSTKHREQRADQSGTFTWAYRQPASTITRHSHTAHVAVGTGAFVPETARASYRIRFGDMDVSAEPSLLEAGKAMTVWVHTKPQTRVELAVASPGFMGFASARTADNGWASKVFKLLRTARPGRGSITAQATANGRGLLATTHFTVEAAFVPTLSIVQPQVQHQVGGAWQEATQVHLGETVRFLTYYSATEPAGVWFPPGVSGTVRIMRDGKILQTLAMQYVPPETTNPYLHADIQLTDPSLAGQLTAEIIITYGGLKAAKTLQFFVASA